MRTKEHNASLSSNDKSAYLKVDHLLLFAALIHSFHNLPFLGTTFIQKAFSFMKVKVLWCTLFDFFWLKCIVPFHNVTYFLIVMSILEFISWRTTLNQNIKKSNKHKLLLKLNSNLCYKLMVWLFRIILFLTKWSSHFRFWDGRRP